MSGGANAPIIIKRKKVVAGGGHHGGAWKVAYADFVTAMMAFFLLMWLLNATTEKQRKGIADYFSPTIPVNRVSGGGDGALGGDSVFTQETFAQNGIGATATLRPDEAAEAEALRKIEEALMGLGGEALVDDDTMRHIVTRITDEGLVVELFALEDRPLFVPGTAEPTPLLATLVAVVGEVFALARNGVAVEGHSRAHPIVLAQNPSWDMSTDRAIAARGLLERDLEPSRIRRVTGHGDREPAIADRMAVRNDRLEFILLRNGKG